MAQLTQTKFFMKEETKFYANWNTKAMRYYNGPIFFCLLLLFMLIRPLSAGQEFMFFEMFKGMLLRDIRITAVFLGICLFAHLVGYDISRHRPRLFEILKDKVVVHLYKGKVFEFNYTDLLSVDLKHDTMMGNVFEFTLKNGEKQKIRSSIKNPHEALEIIRKKLRDLSQRLWWIQ